MRETWVWSLGWEDPLEKEMTIHSRTIAWKIPWTEEPSRLQAMGSQRVGHDWATSLTSKIQLEWLNRLSMWLFSQTILWRKSKSSLRCSHSVKDSEKINFWQSYFDFKLLLEFWNLFVFLLLFVRVREKWYCYNSLYFYWYF